MIQLYKTSFSSLIPKLVSNMFNTNICSYWTCIFYTYIIYYLIRRFWHWCSFIQILIYCISLAHTTKYPVWIISTRHGVLCDKTCSRWITHTHTHTHTTHSFWCLSTENRRDGIAVCTVCMYVVGAVHSAHTSWILHLVTHFVDCAVGMH